MLRGPYCGGKEIKPVHHVLFGICWFSELKFPFLLLLLKFLFFLQTTRPPQLPVGLHVCPYTLQNI